jgi:hypothetical protein
VTISGDTMPRDLEPDELNKYYYWRQFLLRSKRYKELCAFISEKRQRHPFDELVASWCPVVGHDDLMRPYLDWITDHISAEELKKPFDDELTYGDILESYYPLFQDVFNEPFSRVEHRLKLFYELDNANAIGNAKSNMTSLLTCSFSCNKTHDSPIRHTKDIYFDFKDYIHGIFGQQIVDVDHIITINTHYPKALIEKQFKEYLRKLLEKASPPCPWVQPYYTQGRRGLTAWEDCIEAYDISIVMPDLTPSEIVDVIKTPKTPGLNKTNFTNRLDNFEMYLIRAERGSFPAPVPGKNENTVPAANTNQPSNEYDKIAHLVEARKRQRFTKALPNTFR